MHGPKHLFRHHMLTGFTASTMVIATIWVAASLIYSRPHISFGVVLLVIAFALNWYILAFHASVITATMQESLGAAVDDVFRRLDATRPYTPPVAPKPPEDNIPCS